MTRQYESILWLLGFDPEPWTRGRHAMPESPGPTRAEHLGEFLGPGSVGGPRGAEGGGFERDPRVQRPADGVAADPDRAPLQRRHARRPLRATAARDLP